MQKNTGIEDVQFLLSSYAYLKFISMLHQVVNVHVPSFLYPTQED